MAIWVPTDHPALGNFPHEGFVDLQFIDMTQREPSDLSTFRHEVSPVIWDVNARYFLGSLTVVDYMFEAKVDKGSLLACCLRLRGTGNTAGRYLLEQMVRYACSGSFAPTGPDDGYLSKLHK